MIIALAGRRIDAPDATERRFPPEHAGSVARRICNALEELRATVLVSSAACGADILALEAAGALQIQRRILLPFDSAGFRETSVADRPGDWGERYDAILRQVDPVILNYAAKGPQVYPATNEAILAEARSLADQTADSVHALVVWDGNPRSADDVTAHFLAQAMKLGMEVTQIPTID